MLLQRANVYRLEPTGAQATAFRQWVGACRFIYNLGLEQRHIFGRPGRSLGWYQQKRELTLLREQLDWLAAVPVHVLQMALKALDDGYQRFFIGLADYPTSRRKGRDDSCTLPDPSYLGFKQYNRKHGAIKLPKIGWVKLRGFRKLGGDLRSITVRWRAGHWYAAIAWQKDIPDPPPSKLPTIGIDRGVVNFAAFSDGRPPVKGPNSFKSIQDKLAKLQRRAARKVQFSSNWKKLNGRIARIHAHAANARKDYLHKLSTNLAKNHGLVKIEKLQVRNMSASARGTVENPGTKVRQKAGLNRAILDQGWSMFASMLGYKLSELGGKLGQVVAAGTSQECPKCHLVDSGNRHTRDWFCCLSCGFAGPADDIAAINIQARTIAEEPPKRTLPKKVGKRNPKGKLIVCLL